MKFLIQTLSVFGLLATALTWSAPASSAQMVCATHDAAAEQLEKKYEEQVVGRGLANAGKAMFEIFVSEKGTWTLVVSQPDGRSCIFASGESWQQLTLLVGEPA